MSLIYDFPTAYAEGMAEYLRHERAGNTGTIHYAHETSVTACALDLNRIIYSYGTPTPDDVTCAICAPLMPRVAPAGPVGEVPAAAIQRVTVMRAFRDEVLASLDAGCLLTPREVEALMNRLIGRHGSRAKASRSQS